MQTTSAKINDYLSSNKKLSDIIRYYDSVYLYIIFYITSSARYSQESREKIKKFFDVRSVSVIEVCSMFIK